MRDFPILAKASLSFSYETGLGVASVNSPSAMARVTGVAAIIGSYDAEEVTAVVEVVIVAS